MDTVVLVGRLLVSLAVVLGVLWLLGRRMNRRGRRRGANALIEVLGRQQLGRHSAVAVVRVAEQTLVLGITESAVSLLSSAHTTEDASGTAGDRADRPAPRQDRQLRTLPTPAPPARPARPADAEAAPEKSALAGSALSPGTWRQAVDALRDMTARTG